MFGFLKQLIKRKKQMNASMREYERKREEYIAMTKKAFSSLSDDELYEAASARIHHAIDGFEDIMANTWSLSEPARVFFVTECYEMEVNNGGLCQFFVNSSRAVAPELSICLAEIGADEHKRHFEKFIQTNGIDLKDLTSFDIDDVSEFEAQTERYDFNQFDDRFYEMKPIFEYLTAYIREHIEDF